MLPVGSVWNRQTMTQEATGVPFSVKLASVRAAKARHVRRGDRRQRNSLMAKRNMVRCVYGAIVLVGFLVLVGLLAGCAGAVEWGDGATSLGDAGQRVVEAAPQVGRAGGTIVGGALGGPAGAEVGGNLGEWIMASALGLLGIGGGAAAAKQTKKRGQAEADKREAEVAAREARAEAAVIAATRAKTPITA